MYILAIYTTKLIVILRTEYMYKYMNSGVNLKIVLRDKLALLKYMYKDK